jgi:hypothetical protein
MVIVSNVRLKHYGRYAALYHTKASGNLKSMAHMPAGVASNYNYGSGI